MKLALISLCERPFLRHPVDGSLLWTSRARTGTLCKDASLWHSCCGMTMPASPGTRPLCFLFGVTGKTGTSNVTILPGSCSEDHRIAGIWGIIQETSALRRFCSVEAIAIILPILPAGVNQTRLCSIQCVRNRDSKQQSRCGDTTPFPLPGSLNSL